MLKHVVIISIVTVLAVGCNESDPSGGKQAVTDAGTTSPDHGSTGTDTNTPDGNGAAGETNAHVDGTQGPIESCPALDESLTNTPLYDHRVQWASSTDGKNFTKDNQVLLEHASVPDAVVRPDGKVWVYFVNGNPGQHAVFVAEQQADGTLKTFDCIRIDGEINGNAVDPDIVLLDDGRYRLFFFQGWFVGDKKPQPNHPFYSAISDDGIHFTLETKILETTGGGTDPTAVRLDDGSWLLAVVTESGVQLATGKDGGAFELTGATLPKGIPELARFDDGTLRLYIAGKDGFKVHKSIDNGDTWTEEATLKLGGADPSFVTLGQNDYAMFYKTFTGNKGPGNGPKPPPKPPQ